ncbi:MAG: PHP domain-containing protein [Halanaerobiales bacterium]
MSADLHIHTIYSDGSYTPQEIVDKAKQAGFKTIAISDHDTLKGIKPALKYAEDKDIEVIPAIEFSTFRGKAEIHILGYFIDYEDDLLKEKVQKIYDSRKKRAQKMIKLLNQENIEITFEEVRNVAGDDYIGRPHIAKLMVQKGYINQMGEAFTEDYIGNGGRAYVKKYKISPIQAINLIQNSGGIPVLAHPIFINHGEPLREVDIKELKFNGLIGIEVYHSKHNKDDEKYYKGIAEKLDLLITGGSDFHGENSPGVKLGDIRLDSVHVKRLKEKA